MNKGTHVIGKWVISITDDTKPSDIAWIYKGKDKEEVKQIRKVLGDNSKQGQSAKPDDTASSK